MNALLQHFQPLTLPATIASFGSAKAASEFLDRNSCPALWEPGDRKMLLFDFPACHAETVPGCESLERARVCKVPQGNARRQDLHRLGAEIWNFPVMAVAVFRES